MPNDETHSIDDLFVDTDGTDQGDDASTSATSTSTDEQSSKDETDKTPLDLSPAQEAKQTFALAWAKKIQNGTATMEELKSKQAWLVPLVQEKLKATTPAFDAEELRKLAREEAAKLFEAEQSNVAERQSVERFNALKDQLNSSILTPSQKATIKEQFTDLSTKLSPYEALDLARKLAQVELDEVNTRRAAAATPRSGLGVTRRPVNDDIEGIDIDQVNATWSRDQRADYLKKYPGRN